MSWTDERVELLKKLWADGLSASQIAAELGRHHPQCGDRQGAPARPVGAGQDPLLRRAAPRKPRSASQMLRVSRPSVRGNTALAHAYDTTASPSPN